MRRPTFSLICGFLGDLGLKKLERFVACRFARQDCADCEEGLGVGKGVG